MLEALYDLLFQKIPLFSRKRKLEGDVDNEVQVKYVKYSTHPHRLKSSTDQRQNSIMEKENNYVDDTNEEVSVIREIKPNDWMTPRESFRFSSEPGTSPKTSLPPASRSPSVSRSVWPSSSRAQHPSMSNRPRRVRQDSDIQHLATIRNVPIRRVDRCSKSTSEKLFGPFKSPLQRFQLAAKNKILAPYSKKCLADKMAYQKLLDLYKDESASRTNDYSPTSTESSTTSRIKYGNMLLVDRDREKSPLTPASKTLAKNASDVVILGEYVHMKATPKPINSLEEYLKSKCPPSALDIIYDHSVNVEDKRRQARLEEAKLSVLSSHNETVSVQTLEDQVRQFMRVTEPPLLQIDDEEEGTEEDYYLPDLTEEQEMRVDKALHPHPPSEVLANKYGLQITRKDMNSLKGLNWLNDEVINFYMNLIMERSEKEGLPSVYAFNTFFYPNMVKGQYAKLKRWTRKVDLFAKDLIIAPVHLGMHWCMSVIDFRSKEIRFYDSMGSENNPCLNGLLQYLQDESQDKKKVAFDTAGWKKINVQGIPQQMNGSDCGVFSCIFAEHLTRDVSFQFSQDNMPYFRKKMVIEILDGRLIT